MLTRKLNDFLNYFSFLPPKKFSNFKKHLVIIFFLYLTSSYSFPVLFVEQSIFRAVYQGNFLFFKKPNFSHFSTKAIAFIIRIN